MLNLACLRRIATAALILSLAGCSIYSAPGGQPAPVETREPSVPGESVPQAPRPPSTVETVPQAAEPRASDAYGPLLAKADQALAGGDYESALALLERAQRIDPNSGEVYLALAEAYAAKGDLRQARATAERGMLYCHSNSECAKLRAFLK